MSVDAERWEPRDQPEPIPAGALRELEPGVAERLRARIVLSMTCIGAGLSAVFWVIGAGKDVDSAERVIVPVLGLVFGALAVLTWRGHVRVVEIGVLALGGGVLLERLSFVRHLPHPGLLPVLDAYELLIWFPCVYLVAFLVLEKKHALAFSLGLLVASLAILRDWLVPGADRIYHADMTEFYIGQLGCIVVVYALSIVRERLHDTRKLAVDLRDLADTDFLTGVPNRHALTRSLGREITRCRRHGGDVAVILLDVDHFKRVNDSLGHDGGDRVLRRIARLMDGTRRESDEFGRWGGEEFLLIAPDLDVAAAHVAAERLRTALEESGRASPPAVTASFGVSAHHFGDDVASVVKRADDALMRAKRAGRNCVVSEHSERPDADSGVR